MHGSFVKDIALVLGVAALIGSAFFRFRLPSILGYLTAGLIIGPYIPIPLFADPHRVESLSEFGVILVMFAVGLEFSIEKFFRVLPTAGVTAALEISGMFLVGLTIGYFLGWSTAQSIFLGGALAISSTMIVSKVFEDQRPTQGTRDHVFGVLVIQDMVAILLLTVFGTFAVSKEISLDSLAPTLAKMVFVVTSLTLLGLFVIPRFVKHIVAQNNSEVLIVVATGLCFTVALVMKSLGYSVALGAFLAGVLVSESGESHRVESILKPLKDVFVAIFFVSVGMTVDPLIAIEVLPQSVLISVAVVVSQFLLVFIGSVLSGSGLSRSLCSSISLGQIGEFSFIIAAIGFGAGMVTKEFQAIVVSVAILTSLSTLVLWNRSEFIVSNISKKLPESFRIAVGFYETWFRRMRDFSAREGRFFGVPKKVIFGLLFDLVLLILIPPLFLKFLPATLSHMGIAEGTVVSQVVLIAALGAVLAPIIYGFVIMSSALIARLSQAAFSGDIDGSRSVSSVQRLFNLTIWTILGLMVAFPLLASIRPFINNTIYTVLVLLTIPTIFYRLWRSAGKVAFECEAGSEKLISMIKRQTMIRSKASVESTPPSLPGFDNLVSISMNNNNLSGKTIAELNVRKLTGATIVSILRDGNLMIFPNHLEEVHVGDTLHLSGDEMAIESCREMFR